MKRRHLLKSTLCLLMALVCHVAWAEVTPPTFSTEDAPVWYYVQFKAGGNLLNAPDANGNLKTIATDERDKEGEGGTEILSNDRRGSWGNLWGRE